MCCANGTVSESFEYPVEKLKGLVQKGANSIFSKIEFLLPKGSIYHYKFFSVGFRSLSVLLTNICEAKRCHV